MILLNLLYILIIAVGLIVGFIHGVYIEPSFNILLSWILIGIWIAFTLKVLEQRKKYREYNSPHNTAFFILGPPIIGIFFTFWSNFTGLLGENLLGDPYVSLSYWSVIFGLPYLLYSMISQYSMFNKHVNVYFGTRAINARGFGFFCVISNFFVIIGYWIFLSGYTSEVDTLLTPLYFQYDLLLIFTLIIFGILFITPGIFGRRTSSMPRITSDYITDRTRRINEAIRPQARRRQNNPVPPVRQRTRPNPTPQRQRSTTPARATARSSTAASSKSQKSKSISNYAKYKPKGLNLTTEDFKCIFCFELPKLPSDKGRGIILCPKCKYPAHADEFREWLKDSTLCSRCDSPIGSSYVRNPKVISVRDYLKVIKMFSKK